MTAPWKISGELVLSCNCDVFCPCVISLGRAQPSHGVCHTWWGLHIESGHAGEQSLDGLNVAVLMDIPGPLAEGKWSVGLYIDERANDAARDALTAILSGRAGGTTGWFAIMVAELLGVKRVPIEFKAAGRGWTLQIPKIIDGTIEPIEGADGAGATRIANTKYWMGPSVTVCRSIRSRFRDWGRNWELSGGSAEYAQVEWQGP
ncbi:MAG TPA: DUF1326 domain-containing protein [Myxococcota bacterium]|nr:DUF1326 domain-containing protein [Myxococcota bacterium]